MADIEHMEKTLRKWTDGFFAQSDNTGMIREFGIDEDDARLFIEQFVRDIFANSGREVRQWTRASVLATLNAPGSRWLKLNDEQWLDAASVLYAYMAYLQNEHHMDNADTISNALDDFGDAHFALDDINDMSEMDEAFQDEFNPSVPIMKLASLYEADAPTDGDVTTFAHDHLSELIMLADHADGMDIVLLSALAAGQTHPTDEFLTRWFNQIVRPEIDFEGVARTHNINLTKPEERRRAEKMVLDSFVNDPSELPREIRIQFAARVDGDPIVDAASQMRFFARHDQVMRKFFGYHPEASAFDQMRDSQSGAVRGATKQPSSHHKPAKVIDFTTARKKIEENKS